MKVLTKCPKCGNEQTVRISYVLMAILWITIVGGIIYSLIIRSQYKCKKCGEKTHTVQQIPTTTIDVGQ